MNYFEFLEPYYALIKADSGEEAVKKYIEAVAGDEDDFENLLEESKLVPEYYAVARFSRSTDETGKMSDLEEVLEILKSREPHLLLVDGSLI